MASENAFQELNRIKTAELDEYLKKAHSATAFTRDDISKRFRHSTRSFTAGWRTDVYVGNGAQLEVYVDSGFPFSLLRIGLGAGSTGDPPPHVEPDGILCLPRNPDAIVGSVADAVERSLSNATELFTDVSSSGTASEFVREFERYWKNRGDDRTAISLLDPKGPTRMIACVELKDYVILAETLDAAHRWYERRLGRSVPKPKGTYAVLLWLAEGVSPMALRSNRDLINLVPTESRDLFFEGARQKHPRFCAVIGFDRGAGAVFGSMFVEAPRVRVGNAARVKAFDGFRRKNIPGTVLDSTFFTHDALLTTQSTNRADRNYMHDRGGLGLVEALGEKRVLLIGAGSLGSAVADLLTKAGVGRLDIVDSDSLTFGNCTRHLLGSREVGAGKANGLLRRLQSHVPSLDGTAYPMSWERLYEKDPRLFENYDIVVSTMGDDRSEAGLNMAVRTSGGSTLVLFGWVEPYGVAGQALLVAADGGCLTCGSLGNGQFDYPVSRWDEPTEREVGACGESFQPYSPLDTAPISAMIAQTALDALLGSPASHRKIWVGRLEKLGDLKGSLDTKFVQAHPEVGDGFRLYSEDWAASNACALCNS